MGLSESHISLTIQLNMTFTLPHQQIFIETSIFTDFFLSVYLLDTVDIFSKICALKKINIRKDLSQNGSKYWIFGRNRFEKIWDSRRVRNLFGRYRFRKDRQQKNVSKHIWKIQIPERSKIPELFNIYMEGIPVHRFRKDLRLQNVSKYIWKI